MSEYANKVRFITCPACGRKRPYDWFRRGSVRCWRCRETSAPKRRGGAARLAERRAR